VSVGTERPRSSSAPREPSPGDEPRFQSQPMLVISPSSPSVMAVTKTAFFRTPLIRPRRSRSGGCFGYAFLGFNGLQTVHSAKPEALVRLKDGAGYNLRAHPAVLGPCARRRWTSAEKQQILALRAPPLVSAMAWLNGLPASVLLMWRRLALEGRLFELTQRGSR